jgi:DNA anti-recombination protein RmuC
MEKTAGEILGLVKNFKKEWEKFTESMDKVGEKLEGARKEFGQMTGVRKTKLDKSLEKIEDLRHLKGLEEEAVLGEGEALALEAGEDKLPEE